MRHNPFEVVRMFEETVAHYTGSPYAVAVDSCTNALFLCCKYLQVSKVTIPCKTYLSVPMAVINAGGKVGLVEQEWTGQYELQPYPIVDAAKTLTSGMYKAGKYMCLSFHVKKCLPIGKGGMILTDDLDAVKWLKRARYEGRGEVFYKDDCIESVGWNMYMTPEEAARGLTLMQSYPDHVEPLYEDYKDLREFPLFQC